MDKSSSRYGLIAYNSCRGKMIVVRKMDKLFELSMLLYYYLVLRKLFEDIEEED